MTDANRELEIAEALATVKRDRARGETPDVLAYRERLGDSHADFIDLVQVDAMIDDFINPPAPEKLPRDFGGYRLVRELGQGAIGVVYEAWHKTLGRKAAVKVLRSGFDRDLEARERFRVEAYATAQVRHDHIVEIFEAGEIEGHPFYAMGLVEGRPLSALIAAKRLPPQRDLCREHAGIADALDTLHRASPAIVHRDVKPSNIMVRPDGRMILADFGLARASNSLALTRTGVVLGTPLYMPPEQMLGTRGELDARADIYALGATLYETVALKPVFPPSTFETVSNQVVSERPPSLRTVAPGCPAAVERIAMKALEKRPEDRYQTAAAMRDQLLLVAKGNDAEVREGPVSPARRALRWGRTPVGLAAAAAALFAISAGVWWTNRSARLDLTSLPDGAEVLVDGASFGRTPLRLPLKPGSYDVVLRRDGFVDRARRIDVSAGAEVTREFAMVPKDLDDPVARLQIAQALKLDALGYKFGATRSAEEALVFVYPRRNVRLDDLDLYGFETDPKPFSPLPDEGGMLEFRRGDETLYSTPFGDDYKHGQTVAPVPKDVRNALHVGDRVTWGLFFEGRRNESKNVVARFTVVDVDPSADFEGFKAWLTKAEYPDALAGELEVRKLWSLGLMSAALARADRLADDHVDFGTLQALAKMAHLQVRNDDSGLRVEELNRRIEQLPKSAQDRLKNAISHPVAAPAAVAPVPGR